MTENRQLIPPKIDANELIVRGIFHPIFYSESKNKVKEEAFLPPPDKKDVSVLRYNYTDAGFCKDRFAAINMGGANQYAGIASFRAGLIQEINETLKEENAEITLKSSPLDEFIQPIENREVYSDEMGLPMHADIMYSQAFRKGETSIQVFRKMAREIAKKMTFFKDPAPQSSGWHGGKITG